MSLQIRQRDKRALVGLGIALVVYLALDLVAIPAWDRFRQVGDAVSAKEDELSRYRRAIERQGQEGALESELEARLGEVSSRLIEAADSGVASAELQSLVEGAAQRTGIGLAERYVIEPRQPDEFVTEVGMRVSFRATVNQLVSLLAEFRSMETPLSVPSLSVTPVEHYESRAAVPPEADWTKQLQVTLIATSPVVITPATVDVQ